jgi:hypothetical protein
MPTFGVPDPLYSDGLFENLWEFWQQFPDRITEEVTPSRVIWIANSACEERYQLVPGNTENPET